MYRELTRGELLIAAVYMLSGVLIPLDAVIDPHVDLVLAVAIGLPLLVVPPVLLRHIVAEKRLSDPDFGFDAALRK